MRRVERVMKAERRMKQYHALHLMKRNRMSQLPRKQKRVEALPRKKRRQQVRRKMRRKRKKKRRLPPHPSKEKLSQSQSRLLKHLLKQSRMERSQGLSLELRRLLDQRSFLRVLISSAPHTGKIVFIFCLPGGVFRVSE